MVAVGSKKDLVLSSCLSEFLAGKIHSVSSGSRLLFKDFLKDYLSVVQNGMGSSAFSNLYSHSRHIGEALGDYRMNELNHDLIVQFLNSLTVKTYTRGKNGKPQLFGFSIISKTYDLLICLLKDAWYKKLTVEDLSFNLKKPHSKKLYEKNCKELSDTQIRTLEKIVSSDPMLCAMIYILLYTGMRPAECKALRFSDIDFVNNTISVSRSLKREIPLDLKTGLRGVPFPVVGNLKNVSGNQRANHAFRLIPVSSKVVSSISALRDFIVSDWELSSLRAEYGNDDYLFTGVNGQLVVPDYYDQKYKRLLKRYGYSYSDFSLYKLRHTFCTRLCRMGVNPKTVARSMGDNTVQMVMEVYNETNREDIDLACFQFSEGMDSTLLGNS